MPRKGGEKRFDLLLHPEDEREAAIIAWIDERRGNYESLRVFMIEVLEWAMTGEIPQSNQAAETSNVTVNVDTSQIAEVLERQSQPGQITVSVDTSQFAAAVDRQTQALAAMLSGQAAKKAEGQRREYPTQ